MLKGENIVVYDLEIKKTIDQCSKGWASKDEMGISVGCAYDYRDSRYKVFMDDNMSELVDRLNEPDTVIVAFNNISFDNELLRANYDLKPDSMLKNYDMLQVSRVGAGLKPNAFVKGFKLDEHLSRLGLPLKTGDGADAPILWQQGKIGQLVEYCLNDVASERALFEHFQTHQRSSSGYKDLYKVMNYKQWMER